MTQQIAGNEANLRRASAGLIEAGFLPVTENFQQEGDVVQKIDDSESIGMIVGKRLLTSHHEAGVFWTNRPIGNLYRPPGGSRVGVSNEKIVR